MRNLNYDTCTFIYPAKPQPTSQLIKPSLANPITKPSTTTTATTVKYCSIPNIVNTNVNIIQQQPPIAPNPSIKYPSSNSISKYIISNSNNTYNVNIYNDDNDDDVFTSTPTNNTHHHHPHPHLALRSNSSSSTLNTNNSSALLKAK
jgi:hypothetical protein